MPYKSRQILGQWDEMTIKQVVNAVICYGIFVKTASRQYGLPLETLRRKVKIAQKGGEV